MIPPAHPAEKQVFYREAGSLKTAQLTADYFELEFIA
jgi:hypothetical protein